MRAQISYCCRLLSPRPAMASARCTSAGSALRCAIDNIRPCCGVLANHPGRYRIRQIDALKPDEALPYDACFVSRKGRPLRAVFAR
jgi:hypothetical protein